MLEKIAELARQHNLIIFSDEIYDKLMLDGDECISIAAVAPDIPVVTFGGMSKNFLAPGWRLGWSIISGDPAVIKPYIEGSTQATSFAAFSESSRAICHQACA